MPSTVVSKNKRSSDGLHREKWCACSQAEINRENLLIIFANLSRNAHNYATSVSIVQINSRRLERVQSTLL